MKNQEFIEKFQIPEVAYPFIDRIFTQCEIDFITGLDKDELTIEDVKAMEIDTPEEFLNSCYHRGIVSIVNEDQGIYKISDFYGRLDIFSISETDTYRSFPKKDRIALDQWYFDAYYEGLAKEPTVRPTKDEILPLNKVLDFIEQQERPVYINYCDCRSLSGDCGLPTRTCITYKNGINSFTHRGLSQEISKERAKEIVIETDRAGLMHTVNPNGICNCCGDCCYLFRAQNKRNSAGFWPKTENIIEMDHARCIGCGKCIRTCHFHVFYKEGTVQADPSKCIGCGICTNACPANALKLNNIALANVEGVRE